MDVDSGLPSETFSVCGICKSVPDLYPASLAADSHGSAQTKPWNEITHLALGAEIKMPIPDLTYCFPIFRDTDLGTDGMLAGLSAAEDVANFKSEFVEDLFKNGIVVSPATGIRRVVENGRPLMKRDERICFPWAIVEVKRDGDPEACRIQRYRQAANGAAAALLLQESLKEKLGRVDDLYPIIAFTCVGPEVKTWLAYSAREKGAVVKVCCENCS